MTPPVEPDDRPAAATTRQVTAPAVRVPPAGSIPVGRAIVTLPAQGWIPVRRVLPAPTPGRIPVPRALTRSPLPGSLPGGPRLTPPVPGSISVTRPHAALPSPGSIFGGPTTGLPVAGSIPVARPLTRLPAPGRVWAGGRSPLPSPGGIHIGRVLNQPRPGRIAVTRVAKLPVPGRIHVEKLVGLPGRSGVPVARVRNTLPGPGSLALDAQDDRSVGDTGLGRISIGDRVVARIAGRAVLDVPDAGGVAPVLIGKLAGGHLGVRETSLDSIPKTTANVDGTRAFVTTTVSIRWPAPIAATAQAVRDSIRAQVSHMAGVEVPEVEVRVEALVQHIPSGPRVQ